MASDPSSRRSHLMVEAGTAQAELKILTPL
jgi:hypothetical protein